MKIELMEYSVCDVTNMTKAGSNQFYVYQFCVCKFLLLKG